MTSLLQLLLLGIVLALIQLLAVLPWLAALTWDWFRPWVRRSSWRQLGVAAAQGLAILVGAGMLLVLQWTVIHGPGKLETAGRVYTFLLQGQLIADFFVLIFAAGLKVWPKGSAVALAAFREALRQPTFWLIFLIFLAVIFVIALVPLWTFGEDLSMTKELNFQSIMLAAMLFATLAASLSISEEIEGRTAITLMSKPVSRRQFLLGKFAGILLAALVMTALHGWFFDWALLLKRHMDRLDPQTLPPGLNALLQTWAPLGEPTHYLRGAGLWFVEIGNIGPGLVLVSCQVMVLLAVAVTLATRLPLIVNLVTCLVVYLLGVLAPVLVRSTAARLNQDFGKQDIVGQMVHFIARVLDTVLPHMEFFRVQGSLLDDSSLTLAERVLYVSSVAVGATLFTAMILVVGLLLFEDRDLA